MPHTIFDGSDAMLRDARWNSRGRRVVYEAQRPASQGSIEIEIPAGLPIQEIKPEGLPHWDSQSMQTARAFGDRWYDQRRTPVLIVPSVVTRVERIL